MSLYDKQTKLGIAVLLLALGLIIGGSIAGHSAISSVQENLEDKKNEATIQKSEGKSDSAYSPVGIDSGMLQYAVAEQQTWPTITNQHSCLLVNLPPPLSYPKELSSNNTIRLSPEMCWAIISQLKMMVGEGLIDPSDLRFP